jgi:putative ABC transport system substrate-binding protein
LPLRTLLGSHAVMLAPAGSRSSVRIARQGAQSRLGLSRGARGAGANMDRRGFVLGIGLAANAPLPAQMPTGKVYRIGYLSTPTRESVARGLGAFLRRLRELGWVEGRNLVIEYRWAEGKVERLPELAADLVRRKVDLIVAPAGSAALAAKHATSSIPIVMIFPNEPVEMGLVASLSRPGGNITGTTFTTSSEIFGKQLQILKEAIPQVSRVAVLRNPADPSFARQVTSELELAARSLNLRLQYLGARGSEEFDAAFAAMALDRADALLVVASSTFLVHRSRLAELAVKVRLPTIYSFREHVEAGGLMAYAVNMAEFVGHAAVYVDKILRGAKPADLPVEQPTRFELAINLKAARALGITIAQAVLLRADEIIE